MPLYTVAPWNFALILALVVSPLWGIEPAVTRDGPYWYQTFNGTRRVPVTGRLHVRSGWDVSVTGGLQTEIVWSCKVRVKAHSQQEAQKRLAGFAPEFFRNGAYLVMAVPQDMGVTALKVEAPHDLSELVVTTAGGAIDISGLNGAVRARTGAGGVKLERIGRDVAAETAGGPIGLDAIEGDAHCVTAGGSITAGVIRGAAFFETGGGAIMARDIGGTLRASTHGGLIRIGRAGAGVVASTEGGSIHVGHAAGMVTARSSAGSIKVGGAAGVECESAGGGIRLNNVSHGLHAVTAMGNIVAQLMANQPFADSLLATRDGDITVLIPSNLGMRIRAENQSPKSLQRIVSEFPGISVQLRNGLAVAEGALNGGGPLLRIDGNGGIIFIKRQN